MTDIVKLEEALARVDSIESLGINPWVDQAILTAAREHLAYAAILRHLADLADQMAEAVREFSYLSPREARRQK